MSLLKNTTALIHEDIVSKLNNVHVFSVMDFFEQNLEEMVKRSDVSYRELVAVKKLLVAQHAGLVQTGTNLYSSLLFSTAILSTGSKHIDALVDGGIYTSEVTEVCGGPGIGKTQLCLSTMLEVVGDGQHVLYVDTGGSFDSARFMSLVEAQGQTSKTAKLLMTQIHHWLVYDVSEVLSVLASIQETMSNRSAPWTNKVKLLVVDCISSVVGPILGGDNTDTPIYLAQMGHLLNSLAAEHYMAVLVTNNAVLNENNELKAALGKSWQHVPSNRILITKQNVANHRTAKLVRSSHKPLLATGCFSVSETGLEDTTDID